MVKQPKQLHTKKGEDFATTDDPSDDSDIDEVPDAKTASTSLTLPSSPSTSASEFVLNTDSGCTTTMVNDQTALQSIHCVAPCPIYLPDVSIVKDTYEGSVPLPFGDGTHHGLLVPELSKNLLSIGQLADEGIRSVFTKNGVKFYWGPIKVNGKQVGESSLEGKKYLVCGTMKSCLSATNTQSLLTWHP